VERGELSERGPERTRADRVGTKRWRNRGGPERTEAWPEPPGLRASGSPGLRASGPPSLRTAEPLTRDPRPATRGPLTRDPRPAEPLNL